MAAHISTDTVVASGVEPTCATAEGPSSFLALLDTHAELDEQFLRHQEALLDCDLARASELFQGFAEGLRAHIRVEEEWLLPVYERAPAVPGGAVDLFRSEHRKILAFLDRFGQDLARLPSGTPRLKRDVIALFDAEAQFKHLVEHHDRREQNILYPALDRMTTPSERSVLWERALAPPNET